MQEYTRIMYAKIVCDNAQRQTSDKYLERCAWLNSAIAEIQPEFIKCFSVGPTKTIAACTMAYTKKQDITICAYGEYFFLGFIDLSSVPNRISFVDNSNMFTTLRKYDIETLKTRLLNTIRWDNSKTTNLCNTQATLFWKTQIPLLNKIVAFEERINKLPEKEQYILRSSLLYDTFIDKIIESGCNSNPTLDHEIDMLFGWLLSGGIHTLETINQGSVENNSRDEYEEKE